MEVSCRDLLAMLVHLGHLEPPPPPQPQLLLEAPLVVHQVDLLPHVHLRLLVVARPGHGGQGVLVQVGGEEGVDGEAYAPGHWGHGVLAQVDGEEASCEMKGMTGSQLKFMCDSEAPTQRVAGATDAYLMTWAIGPISPWHHK